MRASTVATCLPSAVKTRSALIATTRPLAGGPDSEICMLDCVHGCEKLPELSALRLARERLPAGLMGPGATLVAAAAAFGFWQSCAICTEAMAGVGFAELLATGGVGVSGVVVGGVVAGGVVVGGGVVTGGAIGGVSMGALAAGLANGSTTSWDLPSSLLVQDVRSKDKARAIGNRFTG